MKRYVIAGLALALWIVLFALWVSFEPPIIGCAVIAGAVKLGGDCK
jgi:hypothetical protein